MVKIRREPVAGLTGGSVIQVERDGIWTGLAEGGAPALRLDWLSALPPPVADGSFILPFQPRSFRDVLLYERHALYEEWAIGRCACRRLWPSSTCSGSREFWP